MSKKKAKRKITSEEMFDFHKPKYNAWMQGYGAHGDLKYNRAKAKRDAKRASEDDM